MRIGCIDSPPVRQKREKKMTSSQELDSDDFPQPAYQQSVPGQAIELGSRTVRIHLAGSVCEVVARFVSVFQPDEQLRIEFPPGSVQDQPRLMWLLLAGAAQNEVEIELVDSGERFAASHQSTGPDVVAYSAMHTPIQVSGDASTIKKASFQLFNWPSFYGPESRGMRITCNDREMERTRGVFTVRFGPYRAVVYETPQTKLNIELLKTHGGYIGTHAGVLQRCDGSSFSAAEVREAVDFLDVLFSFVLGRWSGPHLLRGYSDDGSLRFEQWGLGRNEGGRWNPSATWFDTGHAEFFTKLAPRLWDLLQTKPWKQTLREIVAWYLEANKGGSGSLGVDSALLLSQSALERIAWIHCVHSRCILEKKDFKPGGRDAASRLAVLADNLEIPRAIPSEMLERLPASMQQMNSLEVITKMRNALVHPTQERCWTGEQYFAVWNTSMWLIEVALLKIIGYDGCYMDRTRLRAPGVVGSLPCS